VYDPRRTGTREVALELRQLRYFVKIADMGSMSRAALSLHVSQPSLSQQISQLEDEIGKPLLIRLPSGVRMTVEGAAFYREALQILRHVDGVKGVVAAAQSELTGHVKVSMVHTQSVQYALMLILKVRERYPRVDLEIFDGTSSDVLQAVASSQRDFGLLINGDDAELLDSQAIVEEDLFLMSHPDHAPLHGPISRSDVAVLPLVLPAADQVSREHNDWLASDAHGVKRRLAHPPQWIIANSVAIFRQAVLAGVAHAIQPSGVLREEIARGWVKATSITPPLVRKVYLSSARGTNLSQAARAIRDLLLVVIQEQISKGYVQARSLISPQE
jgi:LysR family transcriptional regulator, nitrogen assimilation regulatory protein